MKHFCGCGLTCVPLDSSGTSSVCAQYCCTDADCGSGKCTTMGNNGAIFSPLSSVLGLSTTM
jgi:hypothetical protein